MPDVEGSDRPRQSPRCLDDHAGKAQRTECSASPAASPHSHGDSRNGTYGIFGRRLLALDARRLDDRPPLLDLSLLKGCKRFRRLLLAWVYLLREIGEPCAHRCIGERIDDSNVKLGDYVLRRALGCP